MWHAVQSFTGAHRRAGEAQVGREMDRSHDPQDLHGRSFDFVRLRPNGISPVRLTGDQHSSSTGCQ